jgi:DNA-binding response OmpR family regulator
MNATAQSPTSSTDTSPAALAPRAVSPLTRRTPGAETGQMVFVVDDDAMMASLIGAAMEGAGYRVRVFTDGTEADALAATMPPDLVLVDLTMPLLSGAETIARLRKLQPTLPVLVISGLTRDEASAAAPEATAFVQKPFLFSVLLSAVAGLRAG